MAGAAPNFEAAADSGANNVYDVIVRAADGSLADTQAIAVTVANVNEAPVIASDGGGATASLGLLENGVFVTTVQAGDVDGQVTVSASDESLFDLQDLAVSVGDVFEDGGQAPLASEANHSLFAPILETYFL